MKLSGITAGKTAGILAFAAGVGISLLAATHRWGDSAHAIGMIKADGGKARHAAALTAGRDPFMLIATATVIKPYSGSARVVLEGKPDIPYTLSLSGPVVYLGIRHLPKLEGDIVQDLRPGDRIALWVRMSPPALDPVCGMAREGATGPFETYVHEGREYAFCGKHCKESFIGNPSAYAGAEHLTGKYTLAFYDTVSGKRVLDIPIVIKGKGEAGDDRERHH